MIRGEEWIHTEQETADIANHCTEQSIIAKYIEWELVANAYHIHILRGGEIDAVSQNAYPSIIEKSWPAREDVPKGRGLTRPRGSRTRRRARRLLSSLPRRSTPDHSAIP